MKPHVPSISCLILTGLTNRGEGISYLEGSTEAALDVRSGRPYAGAVGEVFRDLVCDWSQEMTQELRGDGKQGCAFMIMIMQLFPVQYIMFYLQRKITYSYSETGAQCLS